MWLHRLKFEHVLQSNVHNYWSSNFKPSSIGQELYSMHYLILINMTVSKIISNQCQIFMWKSLVKSKILKITDKEDIFVAVDLSRNIWSRHALTEKAEPQLTPSSTGLPCECQWTIFKALIFSFSIAYYLLFWWSNKIFVKMFWNTYYSMYYYYWHSLSHFLVRFLNIFVE